MTLPLEVKRTGPKAPARKSRKDDILEVAARLFVRNGYTDTTVRDIADEVGILSGSLYSHFASKEDLLFDICKKDIEQSIAALAPIVASDRSPEEKLRAAIAGHLRSVSETVEAQVIVSEWRALTGERREFVRAGRRDYERLLERIILEGIDAGTFRPVTVKYARLLILSALNWSYTWLDRDGPDDVETIADAFCEILLKGLAARPDAAD